MPGVGVDQRWLGVLNKYSDANPTAGDAIAKLANTTQQSLGQQLRDGAYFYQPNRPNWPAWATTRSTSSPPRPSRDQRYAEQHRGPHTHPRGVTPRDPHDRHRHV